ncbi:MAG: hypothetical protein QM608_21760, partial [Caulobacter sp.]
APRAIEPAAALCAADAARLVGPASVKRTPPPSDGPIFDVLSMNPGGAQAAIAGLQRACADPVKRPLIWSLVHNLLSGSVSAPEGLRLAEAAVQVESSEEAWRRLALARLRQGDEAGALEAWGKAGQPVQPAETVLAEIGVWLVQAMMMGPERRPALALAQDNERRWRALVDTGASGVEPTGLIFAIDVEGQVRESLADEVGADAAYARAIATLSDIRARLPADRPDDHDRMLLGLLASRVRVLAIAGRRDAAVAAAQQAAALAPDAMATSPLTPELAARLRARADAVNLSPRFAAIGRDLAKAGAVGQADDFGRAMARIRAAYELRS